MPSLRRRLRIFAVPRLSMRLHATALIVISILAGAAAGFGLHASAMMEAAVTGAVLWAVLQAWFTIVLFHGLRFDAGLVTWSAARVPFDQVREGSDPITAPDPSDLVPAGDDPVSFAISLLVGLIAAIAWTVVLAGLFWLGINALLAAGLAVAIPLYWIFRRSLRAVAARVRRTRGDLAAASFTALRFSLPYAVVLATVMWGADRLAQGVGR